MGRQVEWDEGKDLNRRKIWIAQVGEFVLRIRKGQGRVWYAMGLPRSGDMEVSFGSVLGLEHMQMAVLCALRRDLKHALNVIEGELTW